MIWSPLDEVEVDAGFQPYLEEDWDCPPAEQENMPNNLKDAPFAMKTRRKPKSHHDLNSYEDSTDETLSEDSDSDFDSVLGDFQTGPADDLGATCVDFTTRSASGYQELKGDIFQVWQQKKKGFAYALGHCISAVAAMSAGIAPKFCAHFPDFRARVQQLLLNVFRNTPLRVTVQVLDKNPELDSQADHLDSTLPACMGSDRIRNQCGGKTSSGESLVSEDTVSGEIPPSEVPMEENSSPPSDVEQQVRFGPVDKKPVKEKAGHYPPRDRRRPNKFGDESLCKMEEGNYSVSTLTKGQSEALLESNEHLNFANLQNDSCGIDQE